MVAIGGGGFIPARMLRTEVCRTHAAATFRSMHTTVWHATTTHSLSASNLWVQWVRTEICHATACSRWPTSARTCSLQTIVCNFLKCALRSQAHLAPLSQRTKNTCIPCSHSNQQIAPHGRHTLHADSQTHLHLHSCTFSCTSSPTHSRCVAQVRVPILAVSLELYDDATKTANENVLQKQWFDESPGMACCIVLCCAVLWLIVGLSVSTHSVLLHSFWLPLNWLSMDVNHHTGGIALAVTLPTHACHDNHTSTQTPL